MWITKRLTSLDICAQMMFEILTVKIFILYKNINQWSTIIFLYSHLCCTINWSAHEILNAEELSSMLQLVARLKPTYAIKPNLL